MNMVAHKTIRIYANIAFIAVLPENTQIKAIIRLTFKEYLFTYTPYDKMQMIRLAVSWMSWHGVFSLPRSTVSQKEPSLLTHFDSFKHFFDAASQRIRKAHYGRKLTFVDILVTLLVHLDRAE